MYFRNSVCIFMLAALMGFYPILGFAASEEGGGNSAAVEIDEATLSGVEEKEQKPKRPGVKEVEAKPSPEAPAPVMSPTLDPATLEHVNKLNSAIEIEKRTLELETIQTRRFENAKKRMEAVPQPPQQSEAAVAEKRIFPMPQGNPYVESILGGNKRSMEATLVFPSGAKVEVSKGSVLEGGYIVSAIGKNGVTIEKNGKDITLMLTAATKNFKPWSDTGTEEQGVPVNNSGPLQARQP